MTSPIQTDKDQRAVVERVNEVRATTAESSHPVQIIAASKQQTTESILLVNELGIQAFGENYLQEALPKMNALAGLDLEWHYIGGIQSNKTKQIANHFQWVQTIDSTRIAQRLNLARLNSVQAPPLNCCIQVNIDEEPQKSGIDPKNLQDLVDRFEEFQGLRLRGLMAIPQPKETRSGRCETFKRIEGLFHTLSVPQNARWDTLSMGMSSDYKEAIECGSTMIRLGTFLFGPRSAKT